MQPDGQLDAVRDWRTARASMAVAPPPPVWSHAGVPPRALICEIITNQRADWNMSCVRNPLRANRYQLYYRQCPDQTDPVKSDRVQVSHARPKVLGNVRARLDEGEVHEEVGGVPEGHRRHRARADREAAPEPKPRRAHLGVDVKVILMAPCIFCMEDP